MKKQPFYRKGIGHPLQQTETNDVLYIDKPPLHQNGTLDPLRGDKDETTDKYTHYTDPDSGTQGKLDSGRSYTQAYKIAKDKGLSPEGESQSDYAKFAKWQLGSYRDSGVWKSREDYASEFDLDETARNSNETISSGGGIKKEKVKVLEVESQPGTYKDITASRDISELSKPESLTPESTKSPSKGYIQAYEKGEGFSGEVLDKEVVGQLGKKELNAYARAQKKKALSLGATRKEARAHKMDIKALGHYASAGETLKERDAQGNIVRESDTEGLGVGRQKNIAGKAREKGAYFTKRANKLRHRMKDHEGHNLRKNEIGGQYYGDKAKFNQDPNFGAHDQRNAQARAAGGSATMNAKTTSAQNLLENEAVVNTTVDTTKLGGTMKKLRKKYGLTSNKEADESIKNIGTKS